MLDVLIAILVAWELRRRLRAKGQKSLAYVLLLVVVWIVGEVLGALVGVFVAEARFGGARQNTTLVALFGFLGAGFGAIVVFSIANQLPDLRPRATDYPEQDHYRPDVDRGPATEESYRPASDEHHQK